MKIGITGASGLVGINLCKKAISKNNTLNILIRKDSSVTGTLDAHKFYGDLNNIEVLEAFCDGCDVIIHSAAMISIGFESYEEVNKVNYIGTKNLLRAAIKKGVKKFIYISSINAYKKNPLDKSLDENRGFVTKGNSYDVTKAKAQDLVLKTKDIHTLSINPTSILGKNDYKPSKLGTIIHSIYKNKFPFFMNGGLDIIDVTDLSNCIFNAIDNGRNNHAYLVSGKWRSFNDIIASIRKIQTKKSTIIIFPIFFVKMMIPFLQLFPKRYLKYAAEINGKVIPGLENLSKESIENIVYSHKMVDNSKAKKELGLKISSLDSTIKDSIDSFKILQN